MVNYREMYLYLFNSVTDALEELEKQRPGEAAGILKEAQQYCEEIYIRSCGEDAQSVY